jgi:hypothetical protein
MVWRVVLGAAFVALVVGCSAGIACTAVGCQSAVTIDVSAVHIPANASVTVCVARFCTTSVPSDGKVIGTQPADYATTGDPVAISVRVTGQGNHALASGSAHIPLPRIYPNGKNCQPACYNATLVLRPDGTLTSA